MAMRKATGSITNQTGEDLTLMRSTLTDGTWTSSPSAKASASALISWTCSAVAEDKDVSGSVYYSGASGSVTISWSNPASGESTQSSSVTGQYTVPDLQGNQGTVLNVIGTVKGGPAAQPVAPAPPPADPPDDHSHPAHVPLKAKSPVIISPKKWLIDIAWQAVNHLEWDQMVLEITENRHSTVPSKEHPEVRPAPCPGNLPDLTRYGVKRHGTCDEAGHNIFYSWCGDYVSWVYWKAWFLKEDAKLPVKATKQQLGEFLNRESLNGSWASGANLTMIEDYAKKPGDLLVWHTPTDDFTPQRGDIYFLQRGGGGHVGIIDGYSKADGAKYFEYKTLDGKTYDRPDPAHGDPGWAAAATQHDANPANGDKVGTVFQGVAQNFRRSDQGERVKGFVDASKLRAALGYR